jgi:hypothetical protein
MSVAQLVSQQTAPNRRVVSLATFAIAALDLDDLPSGSSAIGFRCRQAKALLNLLPSPTIHPSPQSRVTERLL